MLTLRDFAPGDPREPVAASLRAAVRLGRLGHAYLIYGPPGATIPEVAVALVAARFCPDGPRLGAGCGSCRSCRLVMTGIHADLLTLGPAPGKRQITVDAVRKVLAELQLAPVEACGRALIVHPACGLAAEGANTLLKTLEEPPNDALLILVTHRPDGLLPTIRSRCLEVRWPLGTGAPLEDPDDTQGAGEPTDDEPTPPVLEAARAILSDRGSPLKRAEHAAAAIERLAAQQDEEATATERRRRATLSCLDRALAMLRRDLRQAARSGALLRPVERRIRRVAEATEHIERNAPPRLVIEVLAIDLDRGHASVADGTLYG
ncbi:MAG: hypothetical protein ACYTFT_06320 [Planctomycetota bacterium]|jgi:DNA polymerase-3 subunit delta'